MDGIFCELLKQHFADATNIEQAELTSRLYSSTVANNNILITTPSAWTPTEAQRRLAVIVKRNGWKCEKRGFADNTNGATVEGFRRHTKTWRGSHTIFALANEGPETQILAAEVYRFFNHFGPVFRQYFRLLMFEVVEVGTMSQIKEWDAHWGIPITIMYGWDDTWILKPNEPVLAGIDLSDTFSVGIGT